MSEYPDITLVMTTWLPPGQEQQRLVAISKAVESWCYNLEYNGRIHLHVADDGSAPAAYTALCAQVNDDWSRFPAIPFYDKGDLTYSYQQRRGVGASLNAGLEIAFNRSSYVLHAVDDWQLLRPLDLMPWVDFIEAQQAAGVRFFPHPGIGGDIVFAAGVYGLKIDPYGYAFATRPSLWHRRLRDEYGRFVEGENAYEVERLFNEHYCRRFIEGHGQGPRLYLALPDGWAHIDSVELAGVQPE